MRTFTVRIPGRPPGGNALHRMGHWAVRKSREQWSQLAYAVAVQERQYRAERGNPWETAGTAEIAVEWRCKVRRRRDYDNLVSGLKPLLDGLVRAGVIRDDSTDVLRSLGPFTVTVGAGSDETVLTVLVPEAPWDGPSPSVGSGGTDGGS